MTRPPYRAALLIVGAALALCACGIPSTGVVEAGGPASGITATTPIYFVQDGGLFVVRRAVREGGDPAVAIEEMLGGPDVVERSQGVTTQVDWSSGPESLIPTDDTSPVRDSTVQPAATAVPSPSETSHEPIRVTTEGSRVSIVLPKSVSTEFSPLARRQLICTAGRARRLILRDSEPVTVTVTTAEGRRVQGTDEDCPDP